jgi:hypothetical protein
MRANDARNDFQNETGGRSWPSCGLPGYTRDWCGLCCVAKCRGHLQPPMSCCLLLCAVVCCDFLISGAIPSPPLCALCLVLCANTTDAAYNWYTLLRPGRSVLYIVSIMTINDNIIFSRRGSHRWASRSLLVIPVIPVTPSSVAMATRCALVPDRVHKWDQDSGPRLP